MVGAAEGALEAVTRGIAKKAFGFKPSSVDDAFKSLLKFAGEVGVDFAKEGASESGTFLLTELAEYWYTGNEVDFNKKFLEMTGQLPNRKNLETEQIFQDYFNKNPKVKAFAKQANYIKGVDNCEVIVEVFDIISQEYEACVIYNKKTPEKAIEDAAKAVDVLLMN